MGRVIMMDHPLIKHKIGIIRDMHTGTKEFREMISEIAMLEAYESTRDLQLEEVEIETPLAETTVERLAGKKLAIVPILRAGLGMVPGMQMLIPSAKIGHIGMYRDEKTLKPVEYFCKLPPDISERDVKVTDLRIEAFREAMKAHGCKHSRFMCIVAAPEGLKKLQEEHPDVDITVGELDEKLNPAGYIVPGLGDAGDRIFGTK